MRSLFNVMNTNAYFISRSLKRFYKISLWYIASTNLHTPQAISKESKGMPTSFSVLDMELILSNLAEMKGKLILNRFLLQNIEPYKKYHKSFF